MNIQERQNVAEKRFNECLKVLLAKGKDYAGKEDSLANFKRNAERLGLSKYQVWATYFNKHIDSVNNAIKYNPINPQVESEPLTERIIDIINYAVILEALLSEDKCQKKSEKKLI